MRNAIGIFLSKFIGKDCKVDKFVHENTSCLSSGSVAVKPRLRKDWGTISVDAVLNIMLNGFRETMFDSYVPVCSNTWIGNVFKNHKKSAEQVDTESPRLIWTH